MIALQPTLPSIDWMLYNTRRAVGAAGEISVAKALERQGYRVDISHHAKRGDLLVLTPQNRIFQIEVKTSRSSRAGWQFTLYKHWQGRECADHRLTDLVICLCLYPSGLAVPFVIPTRMVADQHTLKITSDTDAYNGKYAWFRQRLADICLEV